MVKRRYTFSMFHDACALTKHSSNVHCTMITQDTMKGQGRNVPQLQGITYTFAACIQVSLKCMRQFIFLPHMHSHSRLRMQTKPKIQPAFKCKAPSCLQELPNPGLHNYGLT